MAIADVLKAIRSRAGKFLCCTSGNVMMIATLAAIPVIGAVGLVVDYLRASEELQHVAAASTLFVNLDWEDEELAEPIQLKQAGRVFVSQ